MTHWPTDEQNERQREWLRELRARESAEARQRAALVLSPDEQRQLLLDATEGRLKCGGEVFMKGTLFRVGSMSGRGDAYYSITLWPVEGWRLDIGEDE